MTSASPFPLLAPDLALEQVEVGECGPGAGAEQLRERIRRLAARNERLREELVKALTCPVTQLPNRAAWIAGAERLLAEQPAAVLLVDLDRFKPVNDRFGHHVGDAVLAAEGRRLNRWCQARGGCAGRLGGDEFAALVPDRSGLGHALDRLHAELLRPIHCPEAPAPLRVGASIGLARSPRGGDLMAVLHSADMAMFRQKGTGRGHRRARPGWRGRGRRHADRLRQPGAA